MDEDRRSSSDTYTDETPVSPFFPHHKEFVPVKHARQQPLWRRCRQSVFILAAISLLSIAGLFVYALPGAYRSFPSRMPATVETVHPNRLQVLNGAPMSRFRDNLRNDTKYITSWISAGWTNDVMTYANLIYLGLITGRVPIVHTFIPSHVGIEGGQVAFSDVFDIDYLSERIGMPVLEWSEVKNMSNGEIEQLGCWSIWETVNLEEQKPRLVYTEHDQALDISWTRAPASVKRIPNYVHDKFARFWDIATLMFPREREKNLVTPHPSRFGNTAAPDEQLACFDYLYYTSAAYSDEFIYEHSPAWHEVLQHFRWTPRLQNLGNEYLRRMFGLTETDSIPPYITIHARRGDFGTYCGFANLTVDECFPAMVDYARGIAGIRSELEERLGVSPTHVVMVSDEKDPLWWEVVRLMGWYTPDHDAEKTVEKYGAWFPVFIDAVIQSSGVGLLGSPMSTMSVIAGRRVLEWQNGAYHNVAWGFTHTEGGPALL